MLERRGREKLPSVYVSRISLHENMVAKFVKRPFYVLSIKKSLS